MLSWRAGVLWAAHQRYFCIHPAYLFYLHKQQAGPASLHLICTPPNYPSQTISRFCKARGARGEKRGENPEREPQKAAQRCMGVGYLALLVLGRARSPSNRLLQDRLTDSRAWSQSPSFFPAKSLLIFPIPHIALHFDILAHFTYLLLLLTCF